MNQSFQDALSYAPSLLSCMDKGEPFNRQDTFALLSDLLSTESGARGFFVTFLTGDYGISDSPPASLIDVLKKAPEHCAVLLAKNIAMSSATRVGHMRQNSTENAAGSELVAHRSIKLAQLLSQTGASQPRQSISALLLTIQGKSEDFQDFLARMNYDAEQLAAAECALEAALA